ncbi:MAG: anti-sigma factor [Candidatus Zixiibacteriota bacterium]
MNKCSDIEKRLLEIVEGSLGQSEVAAIEAHLRECPSCGAMVAHYQAVFQTTTATAVKAPESLWRSIQNRINELEEGHQSQPTRFPKRRPLFGLAMQTVGLAIAIVAGVYLGQTDSVEQVTFEDEIASYYAGALTETPLPLEEVYEQVSQEQGGSR